MQQDLDADLGQMRSEVDRAVTASQGGFARMIEQTSKVERQIAIIKNRCQKLNNKASEVAAVKAAAGWALQGTGARSLGPRTMAWSKCRGKRSAPNLVSLLPQCLPLLCPQIQTRA